MTGNKVEIQIGGSDAEALKMWQRQHKELDKQRAKLEKMGRAGKKAGKDTKMGFSSAMGSVKEFSSSLLGATSIVGGVAMGVNHLRVELAHLKALNKKDAETKIPFEDSLVQAYKNSSGLYKPQELEQIVVAIEEKTGVTPAKIATAIGSAFSAKGPQNKAEAQEAINATIAALKFSPKISASESADLTGAGIDLAKRFGFTPEESLGFLQSVGGQARVVDPGMLANNAAPAISNLASYGNTATESGALVAALTQGATDKTAAMTGTAAISLASQLKKRGIGNSTAEGIDLLAGDPELKKRFIEGGEFNGKKFPAASFEQKSEVAIQQLFEPGSVTREAFKGAQGAIGGKKEAQEMFDLMVKASKMLATTSDTQRRSKAAADVAHIKDQRGAAMSEATDVLNRTMDAANYSWLTKQRYAWEAEAKFHTSDKDPRLVVSDILKTEQDRLLLRGTYKGGAALAGKTEADITKEDRETVATLERQITILVDAVKASSDKATQERAIKAQEANTKAMERVAKGLESQHKGGGIAPAITGQTGVPGQRKPFKLPAEALNAEGRR